MKGRDEALAAARAHLAELGPGDPGRAELEAAIARVTDKVEEEGAQKGFISQQYPTSGMPLEKDLPKPIEPKTDPTRTAMGFGPHSITTQQYPETIVPEEGLSREERAALDYGVMRQPEEARAAAVRPSEHIAPPGVFNTLNPLDQIRNYLPSWVGGNTEMWEEPKLAEFRSDPTMRGVYGPGIDELGTDSQQYQDYANNRWAMIYDDAQQMGRNIVRQSAVPAFSNNTIAAGAAANRGLTDVGRGIDALVGGAVDMVTPGLQDPTMKADVDEMPFMGGIGSLIGAIASPIAKGVGKLTGLVKAPGLAGSTLRGAATGGLAAGVTQGLQDLGDAARGDSHWDEASRLAIASALGLAGGAAAGFGGAATRGLRDPLTETGRGLNMMETALGGGESNPPVRATRFLGGLKVTPGAEAAAEESKMLGLSRDASPTDILAGKVASPIAKTALAEDAALKAELGRTDQAFYASQAGQSQVAPRAFVGKLRNRIEKGTFDDGSPLPLEHTEELKKALNDAVEVMTVMPENRAGMAKRYNGNIISVRDAQRLGFRVGQGLEGDALDKTGVIIIPKPMNAEQMDIMLRNVDSNANAASIRGSEDPVWSELQRAGRIDRDRFGSDMSLGKVAPVMMPDGTELKGWGAYKHRASEQITDVQRRMLNAGIPQGQNVGIEQATQGVRQRAVGFREPNRSDSDAALMSFMGGQTGSLWDIPSARVGRTLQPSNVSRSSILRNMQLRLDPTFSRLEAAGMPVGIAAGAGNLGPGIAAGYRDLQELTPFTFQEMRDKLSGTKKPHENHPRRGR